MQNMQKCTRIHNELNIKQLPPITEGNFFKNNKQDSQGPASFGVCHWEQGFAIILV
jgi:hypothetical protein